MNQKYKGLMTLAIALALLAFAYSIVSFANTYSDSVEPSSFRSFEVSAEGKEIAVPDVAKFSFSVVTEGGTDVGSLQRKNTKKMNRAIQFVKDQGIEEKDIKTQDYNLEPRYKHYGCEEGGACPPPEIVGYKIRQKAKVKIRDFKNIGDIVSGVVENGANTVSRLNFTIDDPTEVETKARVEAIKKAKKKAKAIAEAGDFRMGQLLSVDEGSQTPIPRYREMQLKAADAAGGAPSPSIEPGSKEVKVNVTLRYEIE